MEYSEDAANALQQEGASSVLQGILDALNNTADFNEAAIQEIIKQVVKEKNVKKGLVMRSLRAALTKAMHGPDLVQSWLILHQLGQDKLRLQQAIELK